MNSTDISRKRSATSSRDWRRAGADGAGSLQLASLRLEDTRNTQSRAASAKLYRGGNTVGKKAGGHTKRRCWRTGFGAEEECVVVGGIERSRKMVERMMNRSSGQVLEVATWTSGEGRVQSYRLGGWEGMRKLRGWVPEADVVDARRLLFLFLFWQGCSNQQLLLPRTSGSVSNAGGAFKKTVPLVLASLAELHSTSNQDRLYGTVC